MSTIEVTCQCGKVFHAPAAYAGKRGRCKRCGATVEIPDDSTNFDPADDDPGLPVVVDDEDDHPARRVYQKSDPHPAVVVERKIPPEPWYYRFLDGFAACIMGFGLMACGIAIFVGVVLFAGEFARDAKPGDPPPTAAGLALVGIGSAAVVPVLLASAPIFLAVNVARHVRAIRFKLVEG